MKTSPCVVGGIAFMLLGIAASQAFVLPRIHTCPPQAACPGTYDPNITNALQLLQTFMSYWLKAGVMIASIGILKLSSYQAWFILMHQGNTVRNLDLNLGAIRGSLNDACFLLLKKNNRILSLFVLGVLGVDTAISLITGLSITKANDVRYLSFQFNGTAEFPDNRADYGNSAGQLLAMEKVVPWALNNDQDHGSAALRGTLVRQDSRAHTSNALPAGPKITGSFVCEGATNFSATPPDVVPNGGWYIFINGRQYIAQVPIMPLDVAEVKPGPGWVVYLWVSNTTGLLPNASTTPDGQLHMAICNHTLEMVPPEPEVPGVEYLVPSEPIFTGCRFDDPNICIPDSVANTILFFWGGLGTSFMHIRCRGGILGPVPSVTDDEFYCPITQGLWSATGVAMLDGIMQTAPSTVMTSQFIHAEVQGLSKPRWWLNALIPAVTLMIYLIGLGYACKLSKGDKMFKELSLAEVVRAAQTDHVHDLISMGQLKKGPIRYDSQIGFVATRFSTKS